MPHAPRNQHGVVLVVSLILLLLLTVLAITASTTSSLQERMAANAQESNVAFQAAESGLAVTTNLLDGTVTPGFYCLIATPCGTTNRLDSTAPPGDTAIAVPGPSRTTYTRVQTAWRIAEGNSLSVNGGTPEIVIYDITSSATLDPTATSAGAINNNNTHALHLQGYRDLEIR